MRISVNYDKGQIFQHFGQTEMFKIYDVEDGKIVNQFMLPAVAQGHGALAQQLIANKVNVAICGGLGMGMLNALESGGIEVCANVTGNADDAVSAYLSGNLLYNKQAHSCSGHHH